MATTQSSWLCLLLTGPYLRRTAKALTLALLVAFFWLLAGRFHPIIATVVLAASLGLGWAFRRWCAGATLRRLTRQARQWQPAPLCHWASPADLGLDQTSLEKLRQDQTAQKGRELVLGPIDQDGRVLWPYGPSNIVESVDAASFLPRHKHHLFLVLCGDRVLVRKDYGSRKLRFLREWANMALLGGIINVPSLDHIDEDNHRLYMQWIPGLTMRDLLVRAGAQLRDSQTKHDTDLNQLSKAQRSQRVAQRGTALVETVLSRTLLQQLHKQLDSLHAYRVAGLDLKFGNVIVDRRDNAVWLIDFENPRRHLTALSPLFWYRRTRDRLLSRSLFPLEPSSAADQTRLQHHLNRNSLAQLAPDPDPS